ncbi:40S ribosomal protein S21-like [Dromiciops gliroides]|uniref:40S ribosomal protein S21-like n=1 Tax=Dromiciops gliroides TaxID=33562 RepID=UPI001CC3C651|nr:40S ribosomal protein S21-like [Dromiciops gliroides]
MCICVYSITRTNFKLDKDLLSTVLLFFLPLLLSLHSVPSVANMQNDASEFVDLYVPRKFSASNRITGAKDHTSIQMNMAEVDKVTGRFNGQFKIYAICGAIRKMGESDDSILQLAKNNVIVLKNF